MDQIAIRPAIIDDQTAIERCVKAAYAMYFARMGKEPAPMLADYGTLIGNGGVYVITRNDEVHGLIVSEPKDDHLFIENVAVDPNHQGHGYGRRLIEFAEDQAREHGLPELRLYTNEHMTENFGYYRHLGFEITDRRTEDGYNRVYMRKRL